MPSLKALGGPNQVISPLDRQISPGKGGRLKGKPNRKTAEAIRKILRSGKSPLDYMISVMRCPRYSVETRLEAAKSAAPYVHRKLVALEIDARSIDPAQQITPTMTPREAAEAYAMTIDSTAAELDDVEDS
jgi:hypothetical protein